MQTLLIVLVSFLLSPSSALSSALPSSSSLSEPWLIPPSINNLALPTLSDYPEPEDGIICFNLTTDKVQPVDLDNCNDVIEIILHDPSGAMTRQNFTRDEELPDTYVLPKIWCWNQCCILLTSENEEEVGQFRLVDAIRRAQEIMAKCPPNSKASLGGIAVLGIKTFFVAVDGPHVDEPQVDGLQHFGESNQTMQLEP